MTALRIQLSLVVLCMVIALCACDGFNSGQKNTRTIVDQLGRTVEIPVELERIAALRHFGGKIVYALGKQQLMVERGIYGKEATALKQADPYFASLPEMKKTHGISVEGLMTLNPELVFVYASMDQSEIVQFEQAGVTVVAVKGETLEESFEAITLMADVLGCREKGEQYIKRCRDLLGMVARRLDGRVDEPIKVLFAGPKSIYSAATGNMLQSRILELSGARNVAAGLKGFWVDVSPEQIARWNPDVIFLGSYLDTYGGERLYENPHFKTVAAVKHKRIYSFPSNIGWWDYPAPHCVLGVVWSAKTLYPRLFEDVDMTAVANSFYKDQLGYTFEELGGRLDP